MMRSRKNSTQNWKECFVIRTSQQWNRMLCVTTTETTIKRGGNHTVILVSRQSRARSRVLGIPEQEEPLGLITCSWLGCQERAPSWTPAGTGVSPPRDRRAQPSGCPSPRGSVRLAAQDPRCTSAWLSLWLLLWWELGPQASAESPWGLPPVEDGSACSAKVPIEEVANLTLGNKSLPGGTHSLHYHYLFLSEPGPHLPLFLAVGYMNYRPFVRFDSRVGKVEPCAPWMSAVESSYWENETRKLQGWKEIQNVEMKRVMGYHNHSSGTHSTQRTFGCEIHENGSVSGFWKFAYDGQDYLTLDLETLNWVAADSVALHQKRLLESQSCYTEYIKAYLSRLCLVSLRRYLELGGHSLTRREPPTVQLTEHSTQDGCVTLRCWARGFYPRDISVSWWLGEKELSQETEWVETRPSGDGTYQKWAALHVMEKAQYSCRVQHFDLSHTQNVTWESPPPSDVLHYVVPISIMAIIILLGLILYFKVLRCRGGEP